MNKQKIVDELNEASAFITFRRINKELHNLPYDMDLRTPSLKAEEYYKLGWTFIYINTVTDEDTVKNILIDTFLCLDENDWRPLTSMVYVFRNLEDATWFKLRNNCDNLNVG